ncbi:MAG: hypothetical protein AAF367_20805 [Pseudomonadota bacterium]
MTAIREDEDRNVPGRDGILEMISAVKDGPDDALPTGLSLEWLLDHVERDGDAS